MTKKHNEIMEENKIINVFKKSLEWEKLVLGLKQGMKEQLVVGLSGSGKALLMAALKNYQNKPVLIITPGESESRALIDDLTSLIKEKEVFHFPIYQLLPYQILASGREALVSRLKILTALVKNKPLLIVASVEALLRRLSPKEIFEKCFLQFKVGQKVNLKELQYSLYHLGYESVKLVEAKGQFSVRGGILDIFPSQEEKAFRIEFFDDEIDSIRYFSTDSQRSLSMLKEILITPSTELVLDKESKNMGLKKISDSFKAQLKKFSSFSSSEPRENLENHFSQTMEKIKRDEFFLGIEQFLPYFYPNVSTILDYLPKDSLIVLDDSLRIKEVVDVIQKERLDIYADLLEKGKVLKEQWQGYIEWKDLKEVIHQHIIIDLSLFSRKISFLKPEQKLSFVFKPMTPFLGRSEVLMNDLLSWKEMGYIIALFAGSSGKLKQLVRELKNAQIDFQKGFFTKEDFFQSKVYVDEHFLSEGFEFPETKLIVITEKEIYGQMKKAYHKKGKNSSKMNIFADLKEGDYVVHINHGIGLYKGVHSMEIDGIKRDYLHLKYAGQDTLYVPIDQVGLLQKYLGSENKAPKLSKMDSTEWIKAKNKVKSSVKEMAKELLELYAKREAQKGFAFSRDTVWQREFEETFIYEETKDQLKAIEEVKNDMQKTRPMDRLLCGDVGYGKTEVALRAAFKAVMDSKQVAILVPTTILAQQHYATFKERLNNYPVTLEVLSRFKTLKERKKIVANLANGTIDIVIGTHRLVQSDIKFKDLGLLVVDEEQRFGVSHKEKIKQLQNNVDVLTLTATPIPRTLHMSLVGVRDTSILETPPENRFPVQTYVLEEDSIMLRESIQREIGRNGQVFFMYNRIEELEELAIYLKELVPNALVGIAHGQMKEEQLEEVMLQFIEGKTNVLVCTSIIESGLDIPNVNTLIVKDANLLGLAQLYQLRGRVGRSNRMAYAYFTYRPDKVLSEVAEKRLAAIKEFTEFGSGYKISMRDLEIRGAGNLLGAEQHGHIASVGFDLYCRLLEEAVLEAKGEPKEFVKDVLIELPVEAYLPNTYIEDGNQKVELYKRIASFTEQSEVEELQDEILDRFGEFPRSVQTLLRIASLKIKAGSLGIKSLSGQANFIKIQLEKEHKLGSDKMLLIAQNYKDKLKFFQQEDGYEIRLKAPNLEKRIFHYLDMLDEFLDFILN